MILNHLPISAYSGVLRFDMKIFVNVARLEIGQMFTRGRGIRVLKCKNDKHICFIAFTLIL